ncbi:MAG: molybdate ABC transporter substrate-binding protein [Alphaproteobacteria bacterium]|nr:molybdate ABC transporter substrate-binding protein [Alphaproteobacteria bacterium]
MLEVGPSARRFATVAGAALATFLAINGVRAAEVKVAVAANFTEAANEIGALFEKATGDKAVFSFGATGQFYTQITQSAPFEVFLSADQERPEKAETEGYAVPGSRFTYATGKIVLFSMNKQDVHGEATLHDAKFAKLAICNPVTAPYGEASVEAMKALGVYDALKDKLVVGESISQAYQFVATGNAEVGFVALSQVAREPDKGSRWIVPPNLYKPIAQDAVLLKRGADNPAAKAFITFLKGPEAHAVIEKFGYGTGG